MATEQQNNQPGEQAPGQSETDSQQQEQQGQQAGESTETATTEQQPKPEAQASEAPQKDKDPAKTALLADLRAERDKRQALATENETLKSQAAEATSAKEQATSIQARYDRLEAFLIQAGGPLAKALDSRSFTQSLFESDTDVAELVAKWHKDNPSATSQALGGTSSTGDGKYSPSELLRIAAGYGSSD